MVEISILTLCVIINTSLGLFVYARNPRHIINRLYAVLTLSFVLFPIANYLSLKTDDRLLFIRAVIFFSTIALASLYYLVFFTNNQGARLSRLQRIGVYFTLLVAVLDWTPLVFKGLTTGSNPTPIPNIFAALFLLHLIVLPTCSVALLIHRLLHTRGAAHLQYLYMLIGIAPIFLFAPLTSFILPIVFKNPGLIWVSPLYALCFVLGVGFAIVKYRLFDVRFFAIRAVAYITTLFAMTFVLALPITLIADHVFGWKSSRTELVVIMVGATLVLYVMQYVRRAFDKLTVRIFFRHYYDPQVVLGHIGDSLVHTADVTVLRNETGAVLQDALNPTLFRYLLFAEANKDTRLARELSKHAIEGHLEVIDVDEATELDKHVVEALRHEGIALAVRLRTKHEDLGYMVLGHKQSGEGYTERDKDFLSVAAGEIAIGLQNALRFEEIKGFNTTLQDRVDDATRKLRKTNEKLKAMDETKDDFISMASHQLRTPLTSIKGYVSMVLDEDMGEINQAQRQALNQALISSQRMVFLIADLLNLSRLKTGKFVIEPTPTKLADIIESEVNQLQETAKARELELIYHKPARFPTLMLDETKIRQVAMNFMDNAIYYTHSGGHIAVELKETEKTIELTVTDDGIGVPKHEQPHLFNKFYRAGNARKARPDGTGLGLFMAKKVIVAQGGSIVFHSKEGKGSTFGFSFAKAKLIAPPNANPVFHESSALAVAEKSLDS